MRVMPADNAPDFGEVVRIDPLEPNQVGTTRPTPRRERNLRTFHKTRVRMGPSSGTPKGGRGRDRSESEYHRGGRYWTTNARGDRRRVISADKLA